MNRQANKLLKVEENVYEVAQDRVIRLRFRISDAAAGEILQVGDDLFYLHGGYGGAFPKVEQAMQGCRVGDVVSVDLGPEEGYGRHHAEWILSVPIEEFAGILPELGEPIDGELPDGSNMTFVVAGIDATTVILDGNHPFAGRQLDCRFEVLEIRDSIEAERSAGFAFDGMFS